MTDIALQLDPSEQHVVVAALTLYEALLAHGLELGGDAQQVSEGLAPIAARVSRRLFDLMYAEPLEPSWTLPDLALGDHHIGIGR